MFHGPSLSKKIPFRLCTEATWYLKLELDGMVAGVRYSIEKKA
jgi:hypothetical protein